jgi:hypothetical protein
MTEADWLASSDPTVMLAFIWERTTDRKIQLFNCACCRKIWHLLYDDRSRAAIAAAERYNAGSLNADVLATASAGVREAFHDPKPSVGACLRLSAIRAAYSTCCEDDGVRIHRHSPRHAAHHAAQAAAGQPMLASPWRLLSPCEVIRESWTGGSAARHHRQPLPTGHY